MATVLQTTTADELLRMPEDGYRYELVNGELRKMAPAGSDHGRIAINITLPLAQFVKANQLGVVFAAETGFLISTHPDTVRAPDVAFVSRTRVEAVGQVTGYWPGAPDLAVEVVSPGDSYSEVEEKAASWLAAGTIVVLVLNPRRHTVAIHRGNQTITLLQAQDVLELPEVVPGFRVSVQELFG